MFDALISDTKAWRNSIEAIAALIDEGTLQIDKAGLKLRAMDPSQIALVDFELPASAFDKYKLEKSASVGIDFSELSKITKRSRAEDKIELSLAENRLKMVFTGETDRRFNLAIIESTTSPPKEPVIDFNAEIKIGANILKEALKDAELVSNHVAILADEGLCIMAQGDTGSAEIKFPSENIMSLNVKEKSRAVFALDQLNNLLKASDQGSIISLKLKTDAPLRLEYAIGEGRVVYYLAPRIEST
jgi:proliferating cell nuclear antigen